MFWFGGSHAKHEQGGMDRVSNGAGCGCRADVEALERRVRELEAGADERALIHAGYVERLNRLVGRLTRLDRNQGAVVPGTGPLELRTPGPAAPLRLRDQRGVHFRREMGRMARERATLTAAAVSDTAVHGGAEATAADLNGGGE